MSAFPSREKRANFRQQEIRFLVRVVKKATRKDRKNCIITDLFPPHMFYP